VSPLSEKFLHASSAALPAATRTALALLGLGLLAAACDSQPAPRPDIVLVLVDTLRADHLGAYGSGDKNSPTLDALAAEGVVFERVIAPAPWTQPAVASLFAAVYPGAHRVLSYELAVDGAVFDRPRVAVFDERFTTLAEALSDGGYATAAFVANPFVAPDFGFDQGFDHFEAPASSRRWSGAMLHEKALSWLGERDPERPFFLYLHYMDVHGPYEAPPEVLDPLLEQVERLVDKRALTPEEHAALDYLGRPPRAPTSRAHHDALRGFLEYWRARYAAGVRVMDGHLAALRRDLQALGIWDDTYLIVTADHGEALLDQGRWDHGFSVQDVELHVPLVLRWPGVLAAGRRVAETVRLIDLMPTLLDQLGLPAVADTQGVSLAAHLAGTRAQPLPPAFGEAVKHGPEQQALYADDFKLVRVAGSDDEEPVEWLRDLTADPAETRDAGAAHPERRAALSAALDRQLAENTARAQGFEGRHVPVDAQTQRQLEALGYLEGGAPDAVPSEP
jgi:arylsulfatase A-like enzyme